MSTPAAYTNVLPLDSMLMEYRLTSVLGVGGFGVTYQALDTLLDKPVAIKEYFPSGQVSRSPDGMVTLNTAQIADEYQWGLDRFLQEARTLAGFSHPHIVRVNRYFTANGTGYMVMDYEEGLSLRVYLQNHPFPNEDQLRALFLPLLDGIEKVHATGFLHRDIKPDNVFVRQNGSPVLIDFGSARRAQSGMPGTMTSLVSPGYAPFEQYTTGTDQGPWSDLYALGGVFFFAMTGSHPPDALTRTKTDRLDEALLPARQRYSERLVDGVRWAMAMDEKARPQNVAEWRIRMFGLNPVTTTIPPLDLMVESGLQTMPEIRTDAPTATVRTHQPEGPLTRSGTDIDKMLEERERLEAALQDKFTRVLTVVFTDLKGSTTIAETQGDMVSRSLIKQHNEIVFPAIKDHNGVFIKSIGDGTLSYFEHAQDAVRACVRIQKGMDALNMSGRYQVPVLMRIGMHTGKCIVEKSDIFGDTVNTASRFESSATAGDIYISEDTFNALSDKSEVYCRFIKEVTLKGKKEPYRAYKVFWNPVEIEKDKVDGGGSKAQTADTGKGGLKMIAIWSGLALAVVLGIVVLSQFLSGTSSSTQKRTIEQSVNPTTPPK